MKLPHKACMPGVAYMPYKIQANKMISLNIEYYMICDMIANIVQYIEQSTVTSHWYHHHHHEDSHHHNHRDYHHGLCFRYKHLGLFYIISSSPTGYKITEELKAEELLAFRFCNFDLEAGLTWVEVENCEEAFAEVFAAQNIPVPTEEDFNSADLNSDGILFFEEWEQWVGAMEE